MNCDYIWYTTTYLYIRNWLRILGKQNAVSFNIASIHLPDKEIPTYVRTTILGTVFSTTTKGCTRSKIGKTPTGKGISRTYVFIGRKGVCTV
jgi:hypothetical protein